MFLWAYNKGLKIGAKYGRIYSGGGWKLGRLGSLYCMGLRGGEKFCMEDLQRRFLKDNTDIINAIISISIIIFMFYAQLSASPQLHQKKSRNGENIRKSPPSKKTKKTNLDFSSDSPSYRWTDPLAEIWMHWIVYFCNIRPRKDWIPYKYFNLRHFLHQWLTYCSLFREPVMEEKERAKN